jgi:hypothetical protein
MTLSKLPLRMTFLSVAHSRMTPSRINNSASTFNMTFIRMTLSILTIIVAMYALDCIFHLSNDVRQSVILPNVVRLNVVAPQKMSKKISPKFSDLFMKFSCRPITSIKTMNYQRMANSAKQC